MGAFYDEIPDNVVDWIKEQKMFWVASAPLSATGTVNVSPKGYDSFNIVSPTQVWYLDGTGSGNETISHMREKGNGRLTIMFNAFTGPPRILRLFGHGRVLERDTPEFNKLLPPGDGRRFAGARAIVWLDIERVGTSCGYSVPYYHYEGERDRLIKFFETKEAVDREFLDAQLASPDPLDPSITLAPADVKNSMRAYWKLKNAESVDGLPGLEAAGWPPEEGAIRKSRKGIAGAFARKTAGGMTALKAREGLEWLRGRDWRVEAALVVGILSGIYIGREYL